MSVSRRLFLAALGVAGVAGGSLARAGDLPQPLVAFDDELKNGFQNWSWAKTQLSVPAGNGKAIRVEGDPWSALVLHHEPFSTEGYTKLTFVINGGKDGGQALTIRAMAGGKAIDANYAIQPKAKTWAVVEVPLKDLNAAGKTIEGISLQAQGDPYSAYYIARIQFE
ncbi:hypothetical protein HAV22_24340 [Massilia sp. TW-1]|uniref:Uncharacterized protein n=1 Tax=Telluria antibiotica TaxID=2717319 RepID=A0ABX0PLG2_9BURK|nr:hypothetical protein [Telluria antibiotica]NIA56755.1 hypothetical protein [Telluria antibiotica]